MEYSREDKERIGEFFIRMGILTSEEVEMILKWQEKMMPRKKFGEIGIEKGLINRDALKKYFEDHKN